MQASIIAALGSVVKSEHGIVVAIPPQLLEPGQTLPIMHWHSHAQIYLVFCTSNNKKEREGKGGNSMIPNTTDARTGMDLKSDEISGNIYSYVLWESICLLRAMHCYQDGQVESMEVSVVVQHGLLLEGRKRQMPTDQTMCLISAKQIWSMSLSPVLGEMKSPPFHSWGQNIASLKNLHHFYQAMLDHASCLGGDEKSNPAPPCNLQTSKQHRWTKHCFPNVIFFTRTWGQKKCTISAKQIWSMSLPPVLGDNITAGQCKHVKKCKYVHTWNCSPTDRAFCSCKWECEVPIKTSDMEWMIGGTSPGKNHNYTLQPIFCGYLDQPPPWTVKVATHIAKSHW